jgi:hypothetical protein
MSDLEDESSLGLSNGEDEKVGYFLPFAKTAVRSMWGASKRRAQLPFLFHYIDCFRIWEI